MERSEVINYIVKKNGYKSYLEIGVAIPDMNYDLIECENKEGCDPYLDEIYDFNYENKAEYYASIVTYRMTSDEMFSQLPYDKKYDVIFVDGLHTEEQSKRDICNALKHVSENGIILVHDCMPRKEIFATEKRESEEWYGCVYKSMLDLGKVGLRYACTHEGWGFGLIPAQKMTPEMEAEYLQPSTFTYKDYEENDNAKMHCIKLTDFGKKIAIYHNSEYLKKSPRYDRGGNMVYGGTEFWVYGIAEELSKWCFDVTVFTDVFPAYHSDTVKYEIKEVASRGEHFDTFLITTDIDKSPSFNCDRKVLLPFCEYFNTHLNGAFIAADYVGTLSAWHETFLNEKYRITEGMFFRHFIPCRYDLYENYESYQKENAMVWSSVPVRGLRFFIERVMPIIKKTVPDFKLYVCSYSKDHYEPDWEKNVKGLVPMIHAGREELAELQKKAKIWVYPNFGRCDTGGFFNETYCVTAVENALAGNAIVCFGDKDGIGSTLEGYAGFVDGSVIDENGDDFFLHYGDVAASLADQAIVLLKNEEIRKNLADSARKICEKYTWENETAIIVKYSFD